MHRAIAYIPLLGAAMLSLGRGPPALGATTAPQQELTRRATRGQKATATVKREGRRVWIDNVPPAKGAGNGYVRGLETLLTYAGTPAAFAAGSSAWTTASAPCRGA